MRFMVEQQRVNAEGLWSSFLYSMTNSSPSYQVYLENPPLMLGADDKGDEPHISTHAQVSALQEHTDWPGTVA